MMEIIERIHDFQLMMTDDENDKNDQRNSEQPPMKILIKRHGSEWDYLKTVDEAEEFEEIRSQHRMNFSGQTMFGKRTKYICSNYLKQKGGCKFKMLVQMSEDGESFHIYTHEQHNHPLGDDQREDNGKEQTGSNCTKLPAEVDNENPEQKNGKTGEQTEDLKLEKVEGNDDDKEKPPLANFDYKNNKWRLLRTIVGKPDSKLIKTQYEVESNEKDEKRIMFFCLQTNPKCSFRMQLIKGPDGENWKLYSRYEHSHQLSSEQIQQNQQEEEKSNSRKRNIPRELMHTGQQCVDNKSADSTLEAIPKKFFSLLDFKQNVQLLGSELNLNVREEMGCLLISSPNNANRLLVLADEGKYIQVSEFEESRQIGESEDWQKSDLRQFLRAVHGRCWKYFSLVESCAKIPKIEKKAENHDT